MVRYQEGRYHLKRKNDIKYVILIILINVIIAIIFEMIRLTVEGY